MASYVTITLDTTSPTSPTFVINQGTTTSVVDVTVTVATGDGATTGYEMKIWGATGHVDNAFDVKVQDSEGASAWQSLSANYTVRLSSTNELKTLFARIRDDVQNQSAPMSDTITLDTTAPTVTANPPDRAKISDTTAINTSVFTWTANETFVEYEVRVVPTTASDHTTGAPILTTNGSTNVSGSGSFPAATPITTTIKGADLKVASSVDGAKFVKVFVRDGQNNWSNN